ncbi:MAG TPA: AI-2E family transporter, partial [Jiangellaceae bacterium]|nr:AI-2E family transporter [Jiangellaceae bacterium]
MAGREGRRISSRVAAVRARLDERRREVEDRDRQAFGIRDVDFSHDEPAHAVTGGHEAGAGPSVPAPVRALAEWSWRLLVIAAALAVLVTGLWYLRVVTFPLVAAALLAALLGPFCTRLRARGWSRGASAVTVFVGFLIVVVGSLWAVAVVVGDQFGDVADSVQSGLREMQTWLDSAPFGLSREQIDAWFSQAGQVVEENQEVV